MIASPELIFGIYPGGATVTSGPDHTHGPPDDPERIAAALSALQPAGRPLLVRGYDHFRTGGAAGPGLTPADLATYARDGRRLDLVLCYHSTDGDLAAWTEFIRSKVRQFGPHLGMLQVTEEPNNPDAATGGNGASVDVLQAVVDGVIAAKDEMWRLGYRARVGFNAVISFNPRDEFWPNLGARVSPEFLASLDYVGLDFFADVWRPVPATDLAAAVAALLAHYRTGNLAAARIPNETPLTIGENGWPTGPGRSPERQAEVVETVVRAVHQQALKLNIVAFEFFALRDAHSDNQGLMYQFGLLRDNYAPKPAFEVYRRMIAEFGAAAWSVKKGSGVE